MPRVEKFLKSQIEFVQTTEKSLTTQTEVIQTGEFFVITNYKILTEFFLHTQTPFFNPFTEPYFINEAIALILQQDPDCVCDLGRVQYAAERHDCTFVYLNNPKMYIRFIYGRLADVIYDDQTVTARDAYRMIERLKRILPPILRVKNSIRTPTANEFDNLYKSRIQIKYPCRIEHSGRRRVQIKYKCRIEHSGRRRVQIKYKCRIEYDGATGIRGR